VAAALAVRPNAQLAASLRNNTEEFSLRKKKGYLSPLKKKAVRSLEAVA
jgi:hypothetical protein